MSWFGKLISRGLEFLGDDLKLTKGYLQIVGRSVTINSVAVTPLIKDSAGDILLCTGLTKPTDASDGFAKGCIFIDTDVVTGTKSVYENTGTKDSCVFDLMGAVAASEITLAYGSVLVGNASGVAVALDGKGDTKVLVGNGTTMTSVAMSQDLTMTNAGVVSIAKINNLATAAEVNLTCDGNTATAAEITAGCDLSVQDSMTPGVGFAGTGTVFESSVVQHGGIIKTEILIDLTGTASSTTDLDIIGTSGVSHIGQITAAKNGTLMYGQVTCLETPATGVTDIDLYSATEGTGAFDGAVGDLTETALLTKGGAWSGAVTPTILTALPAANEYLYLTSGAAGTAQTYTGGRFWIEFWGV